MANLSFWGSGRPREAQKPLQKGADQLFTPIRGTDETTKKDPKATKVPPEGSRAHIDTAFLAKAPPVDRLRGPAPLHWCLRVA